MGLSRVGPASFACFSALGKARSKSQETSVERPSGRFDGQRFGERQPRHKWRSALGRLKCAETACFRTAFGFLISCTFEYILSARKGNVTTTDQLKLSKIQVRTAAGVRITCYCWSLSLSAILLHLHMAKRTDTFPTASKKCLTMQRVLGWSQLLSYQFVKWEIGNVRLELKRHLSSNLWHLALRCLLLDPWYPGIPSGQGGGSMGLGRYLQFRLCRSGGDCHIYMYSTVWCDVQSKSWGWFRNTRLISGINLPSSSCICYWSFPSMSQSLAKAVIRLPPNSRLV